MIDITLRCFSRARWITVATARGILDAQGNPNPGFLVDEIGQIVLTPAVIDPVTLAVTTPAVMDTWFWVNLRITGSKFNEDEDDVFPGEEADTSGFRFRKSKLVRWVRNQATPVTLNYKGRSIRTYQFGAAANRIQLIDPRDYSEVRVREWLGGQSW
jgi:hypothetical protein